MVSYFATDSGVGLPNGVVIFLLHLYLKRNPDQGGILNNNNEVSLSQPWVAILSGVADIL